MRGDWPGAKYYVVELLSMATIAMTALRYILLVTRVE